jgi:phospholipase C
MGLFPRAIGHNLMKHRWLFLLVVLSASLTAFAIPPQIKRVVVIIQENRTPDNLFHFLTPACPVRGGTGLDACKPATVTTSCYNISPCGMSNQGGTLHKVTLTPLPINSGHIDPSHSHAGFEAMCDWDSATGQCKVDGAWRTAASNAAYTYVTNTAVTNSDGSAGHLLDPYLQLAKQYGWANFMFQTNQGPSYPAHLYIFGGTSAMTADDDANSTFIAENFTNSNSYGCLAPAAAGTVIVSPVQGTPAKNCTLFADGSVQKCPITNTGLVYPSQPVGTFCNQHATMGSLLDSHNVSWKYYSPSATWFWTAPNAIQSICDPKFQTPTGDPNSPLVCTGAEWKKNVSIGNYGTTVLNDIRNCNLSKVVWVIPNGEWSDHAAFNDYYGPSWVGTVVNAIGNNPTCPAGTPDAGENYWKDTAIVITWDDWGGFSDHVPPRFATSLPCTSEKCKADNELGFRVPLIMVSAYTPAGYISNGQQDFGSILRFIEGVNHIPEGALNFADKRSSTDLSLFFGLKTPRAYTTIKTQKDASFFVSPAHAAVDPDDD